jgi:SSS family solute:Na+ symporter
MNTLAETAILTGIDQTIIVFYMVAILALGVVFSRFVKTSGDFFLAGKSLPFWAIGMSIVVSDIGVLDMVAGAGAAYRYGLAQANFDWIGSIPAMIIVAFLFVPFYWRTGVLTLPEFLGRRYGAVVRNIQCVIWLLFLVSMLAVMIWQSAVFLRGVLDWNAYAGIWVTAGVVGFYTVMGGLTAVVLTDVVQTVIMFVGAAALLVVSYRAIGGWDELVRIVEARGPEFADRFRLLLPHDTVTPYPWSGIVFGLGIVLSTAYFANNQAIIQRVLGARSEWHAKASMLFAGILKLFIPVLIMVPGLFALGLHPDLEIADEAVPTLVRTLLPPGLLGLVFAAFFAALMSSVDSYLNSTTTIIISDAYCPIFAGLTGRSPSDRSCLVLGRILTVTLIVVAGISAPIVAKYETIYAATQTLFSLFQGPTLALIILGIFWQRTNAWGAVTGLVGGVSLSSALTLVGGQLFPSDDPFLFIAFWSFVFALALTAFVSALTPRPPPQRLKGTTWRSAGLTGSERALIAKRLDGAGESDERSDG